MSVPNWPSTLPQQPYDPVADNQPTLAPQPNAVRTQMDSGPAKQRRRFTAVPVNVTIQMLMNEAEIAVLDAFRTVTLEEVLPFNWTNFKTGAAAVYRFVGDKPPQYSHYAADIWNVTLNLEMLP